MRKIVFLDIDGTLTDFEGKLPDSALEALKMAHQNGHLLVICSGRGLTQIRPFFRTSPLFSGIVCAAGALVLADGEPRWRITENDYLLVHRASRPLLLVSSPWKSYFNILRTKLHWGGETVDLPLPEAVARYF